VAARASVVLRGILRPGQSGPDCLAVPGPGSVACGKGAYKNMRCESAPLRGALLLSAPLQRHAAARVERRIDANATHNAVQ